MTKKNLILSIVNICLITVILVATIIGIIFPLASKSTQMYSSMWNVKHEVSSKGRIDPSTLVLIAYHNENYIFFTDYSFLNLAVSYNDPKLYYFNRQSGAFVEQVVTTANDCPTKEEINIALKALKKEVGFDDNKIEFAGENEN